MTPDVILIWLVSSGLCGWLADKKGRRLSLWVVLGLLTGPVGVVILAALAPENDAAGG